MDLDSMDFLDIVMELRKRFNIEVPESDYQELVSMASCIQYLQPLLKDHQLAS
jgi:acyl carrier protein